MTPQEEEKKGQEIVNDVNNLFIKMNTASADFGIQGNMNLAMLAMDIIEKMQVGVMVYVAIAKDDDRGKKTHLSMKQKAEEHKAGNRRDITVM